MRKITALAALVALIAAPTTALAATSTPNYLTGITGTSDQGFHLTWADGHETWTPTRTEALTECAEYETRVERAACRATLRTEYRWMGVTKRTLNHAR